LANVAAELIKSTSSMAGYVAGVLGTTPQDLVGFLGGDYLRVKRVENVMRMVERANERLREKGIAEPQVASISIAAPIIEGASYESRAELRELWARLLEAAMDPARAGLVRRSFIELVGKFEPEDATILALVMGGAVTQPNSRDAIAQHLRLSPTAVEVSFLHLIAIGCLRYRSRQAEQDLHLESPVITPIGRELMQLLGPWQVDAPSA